MRRRIFIAGLVAVMFASTATVARAMSSGDYNLNPAYCHQHTAWDPLWWVFECWLPDPPEGDGQVR